MRYFYDTEFIDNGRTIELISIGVAAEDGREYYARLNRIRSRAGGTLGAHTTCCPSCRSPSSQLWRSRRQIRSDLEDFFGIDGDEPIELWAWVGAYDHVVLCQLWGPMTALPPADPAVHPRAASVLGGARLPPDAAAAARRPRRARRRPPQPAPIPADDLGWRIRRVGAERLGV